MDRYKTHPFSLCTTCQNTGHVCTASYDFAIALSKALSKASDLTSDDFCASGYAQVPGCDRACSIGWHCSKAETCIFGDIDTRQDLDQLVQLARSIGNPSDGNSSASNVSLRAPIAVPAFMLVLDNTPLQASHS